MDRLQELAALIRDALALVDAPATDPRRVEVRARIEAALAEVER